MKNIIALLIIFFLYAELFPPDCFSQSAPPIVFVSRNLEHNGNLYYPQSGLLPGMGPFSRFKVVGGKLLVRESIGTIRVLVDSSMSFNGISLVDVSDPCVFWDASKVIFAGIENRDSCWRIYEINSDGTNFRKVTFTNRNINLAQFGSAASKFLKYHDIQPCYFPDGRICFASSRYPSLSEFNGMPTTNLYVINPDGTRLHRITSERNSAEQPTIDPVSGKIIFSRWWLNIDMPSIVAANGITRDSLLAFSKDVANVWQIAVIRPDGDALQFYSGLPETRIGMHNYKPAMLSDGSVIGTFVPHTPMVYTSGSTGIRWFVKGPDRPHYIAGVNPDNMQLYIQNPPSIGTMQPPYAVDPVELPDGKILISYALQVENQDYALYTINLNGTGLQLLYDIPGKLELNAQPLISTRIPPVVPDLVPDTSDDLPPTIDPETYFKNGGFRFDCVNIFTNADVDLPVTDAPPITKNAQINFFLNFQRRDSTGKDTAIFLSRAPISYSGAIHFDLAPAEIPMFEQVVDSNLKVISGSKGQIAHVTGMNYGRTGTGTKCVGCHAGHTTISVPVNLSAGQYFNTSTSSNVTQSSFLFINDSLQFPGQRVVDRKARNDSLTVNWIANGTQNEFVELNWEVPVDVKSITLYNVKPNPLTSTNIQVTDCEIFLYFNNVESVHIPSTGILSVNGTKINTPTEPATNRMRVFVRSFTGLINGQSRASLAEVETYAKISFYEINGIKQINNIAFQFNLSQNYPNPFNPKTIINYTVPKDSKVTLIVYDISGREVSKLVDRNQKMGSYDVNFDGSSLASGVYFYNLSAGSFSQSKKMVFIK